MLIGFTIVAAPLLFAIVNAAVQMNRMSIRSEQLVVHGMQGTRNNQRMFDEIAALERTARLYQIPANADLLEAYARNHAAARAPHLDELLTLPLDESQEGVRALKDQGGAELLRGDQGTRRRTPARMADGDRLLSADVGRPPR